MVAQQILCILYALSQRLKRFVFEGAEINLVHSCGIFITMNPGEHRRIFCLKCFFFLFVILTAICKLQFSLTFQVMLEEQNSQII